MLNPYLHQQRLIKVGRDPKVEYRLCYAFLRLLWTQIERKQKFGIVNWQRSVLSKVIPIPFNLLTFCRWNTSVHSHALWKFYISTCGRCEGMAPHTSTLIGWFLWGKSCIVGKGPIDCKMSSWCCFRRMQNRNMLKWMLK
jgi:hypothetical protein